MNLLLDFGINMVMVMLLAATIFYCWLLNKRIQVLQDSKSDLAKLLNQFDHSTLKATESIAALQVASKKIGETIQARIEKANYVMDDLNYMVERASKAADQMEAGIAIARQKDKLAKHSVNEPEQEPAVVKLPSASTNNSQYIAKTKPISSLQTPETLSQAINLAEMVLGEPLTPSKIKSAKPSANGKNKGKPNNTLSSLQALIEKVAERRSDPVLRSNQKTMSNNGAGKHRSQSEEDLLEALRYNSKV